MSALLLRADASASIGTGHVLRCLALAQAWQDAGGEAVFACASLLPALEARLVEEGCRVERLDCAIGSAEDALATARIARQLGATWVVGDSYAFDFAWQRAVVGAGARLLALDDYGHAERYAADIVLNPNAGATASFYAERAPHSQILAGAAFAPLRREFRMGHRAAKVVSPRVERVLITMGGTDVLGLAPRALRWLDSQDFRGEAVVLCGTREWDIGRIGFPVQLIRAGRDVPDWMRWCDLALAAAGSTTWELACCGAPAILSIAADNQRAIARWCVENGVALSVGEAGEAWEARLQFAWRALETQTARHELSARAQAAIDGQGAASVVGHLIS